MGTAPNTRPGTGCAPKIFCGCETCQRHVPTIQTVTLPALPQPGARHRRLAGVQGQIGERPVLRSRPHTSHKNRLGRLCRPAPIGCTAPEPGAAPTPLMVKQPEGTIGHPKRKRNLNVGPMPSAWRFCPRIRQSKGPGRAPDRLLGTGIKTDVGRMCLRCRTPPDTRHRRLAGVRGQIGARPVPGRVHTHPIKTASGGCVALWRCLCLAYGTGDRRRSYYAP